MGWMDEVGPKTADFLKEFGPIFLKSYGVAMFLKIKADFDAERAEAGDERKLKYRDFSSVAPDHPMQSVAWMRSGPGEGAFSGWSQCYVVQLADGNLAVYKTAKAAEAGDVKKAQRVIHTAGYTVVREVTSHYRQQAVDACHDLGCEAPEVGYSSYSWALTHGVRTNYIFQLHKGAGGGCACLGGAKVEPADAGSENSQAAADWADAMEQGCASSCPRNLEGSVIALAFERAVQKMSLSLPELSDFSDDGTEGQILAHMVFLAVFEAACKPDALEQLRQVPFGQLGLWLKARGSAADIIEKSVNTAWTQLQKQAEGLSEQLEAKIKPIVTEVLKKKAELQDMLQSKVSEKVGEKLSKLIGPVLKPLTSALQKPLSDAAGAVGDIFEKEVKSALGGTAISGELPKNVASALDQLARDSAKLGPLDMALGTALLEPLAQAKLSCGEALASLHPCQVVARYRQQMLELLDAMAYTAQEDATNYGDAEALLKDVSSRAKSDAKRLRKEFVSGLFVELLLGQLKEQTKEFVDPIIETAQSAVPEDLSDIIDVEGEFNSLLDATIGAAVAKAFEPK